MNETTKMLPMTREEMTQLGWDELDVLLVTGDAYVDHPSFGAALIGRLLLSKGYRVGIVAQPRWNTTEDIARMGRPRLFAGVTAGSLDSMLAHYTAFRKKRHDDAYTPGGRHGARPNRACIVYTGLLRQAFLGLPVVLGGVEASLRRITHYDFWTDAIRRSILLDSKADLIVYGMGERAIIEIAERLSILSPDERRPLDLLHGIAGTVFVRKPHHNVLLAEVENQEAGEDTRGPGIDLPSHEDILADPKRLMEASLALERQVHDGSISARQAVGDRELVVEPPAQLLDTEEMDALYSLPFTRKPHPSYREPIPAAGMIQFSVTSHRGCGGGCSFCALALHQGRRIASRSSESLRDEVRSMTGHPEWTGSVTDVGGPSANFWGASCTRKYRDCSRASCLFPKICRHFRSRQGVLATLLRDLSRIPGVRNLRVASGVRFDLAMEEGDYVEALVNEFVGGQIKLAPEHRSNNVLRLMRKPAFEQFERFLKLFERISLKAEKEQYVIPYLMSAFPGCTDQNMNELARWLKARGWRPKQVQCFIPTPGTVATAMFHAGIDSEGHPIHVAKTDAERLRQHHILLPSAKEDG